MKNILKKCCNTEWQEFLNYHTKLASYKAGDRIFKEGQNTLGLFIIQTGHVKVTRKSPDYGQRVIRIATDGDVLGHRGFGANWSYPISAYCYTDTTLQFIPLRVLNTILKSNAEFSYQLMLFFAEELRDSEFLTNNHSVKERLAWVLMKSINVFGLEEQKLNFTIPRKDMASFARTTYESIIRNLSSLKTEEIIKIEGKDIYILNQEKLQDMILHM